MSKSTQSPRTGLAKLLDEADADTPFAEIVAKHKHFECPECGWSAQTRRRACFVCDYDQPLVRAREDGVV